MDADALVTKPIRRGEFAGASGLLAVVLVAGAGAMTSELSKHREQNHEAIESFRKELKDQGKVVEDEVRGLRADLAKQATTVEVSRGIAEAAATVAKGLEERLRATERDVAVLREQLKEKR